MGKEVGRQQAELVRNHPDSGKDVHFTPPAQIKLAGAQRLCISIVAGQ
jgi:hypothetical protein